MELLLLFRARFCRGALYHLGIQLWPPLLGPPVQLTQLMPMGFDMIASFPLCLTRWGGVDPDYCLLPKTWQFFFFRIKSRALAPSLPFFSGLHSRPPLGASRLGLAPLIYLLFTSGLSPLRFTLWSLYPGVFGWGPFYTSLP